MAPTQPEPSRLMSSRPPCDIGDELHVEQAGRSTTNLHAQVSAASLRSSVERHASVPSSVSSRNNSRPRSPVNRTRSPHLATESQPSPFAQPVSQAATKPSAPSSSLSSRSANSTSSSDEARNRAVTGAGVAHLAGLSPPPPIPASRSVQITGHGSSSSLSRVSTPRSVRDLGHDFDRYYNPFVSRNNSSTDLPTSSPRYHPITPGSTGGVNPNYDSVSGPNEAKRLSDPFDDHNQIVGGKYLPPKAATVGTGVLPLTGNATSAAGPRDLRGTFFYLDDRLGAPGAEKQGYSFPLYWDEKEADDDMHMPMIDDDRKMRPTLKEHFTRDTIMSTIGLTMMVLGLLSLFVVLPVLSSTGIDIIHYANDTPLDKMWGAGSEPEVTWATISNNRTWPLLKNIRTGLIDPDTPKDAYTRESLGGKDYNLVFSDEFGDKNRTFYKGDDPYWFAPDIWYGATMDLEWYDPDAVTTWDGALELRLDAFGNHGLQFRSGMLNSWNQLCFKGGIFEVSVSLPGPGGVHGLWPGVWSMGNLGRPGYLATTDGVWPYTYNECDAGITPNQSSPDGLSRLPGQKLTSCGCSGEDHPSPGTGRGAPEIDIIEVSADWGGLGIAVATQSYQVAPFDVWYYPDYTFMELPDYSTSFVNTYTGGPFQQAVSTTTMLNNSWYDGEIYQKYAYEYTPGITEDAEIAWWVGDQMTMRFDARALGQNGNVGQRLISEEPMSMILNLGLSNNWVNINWTFLDFPAVMRVDYVRLYQPEGEESITCDPPGYETTEYIANHHEAYNNPNYTHWTDIPGYTWPKNTLMHDCSA